MVSYTCSKTDFTSLLQQAEIFYDSLNFSHILLSNTTKETINVVVPVNSQSPAWAEAFYWRVKLRRSEGLKLEYDNKPNGAAKSADVEFI